MSSPKGFAAPAPPLAAAPVRPPAAPRRQRQNRGLASPEGYGRRSSRRLRNQARAIHAPAAPPAAAAPPAEDYPELLVIYRALDRKAVLIEDAGNRVYDLEAAARATGLGRAPRVA
ncbi:hypothetical protein ACP4OV_008741 [Aristida adscensionis]